jgi:hypothetical protein
VITTLVAILAAIAVGGRANDALRTAQMESILTRLPDDQARAYYDLLRRRLRRVLVMRALAIASLFCIFYTLRRWLVSAH